MARDLRTPDPANAAHGLRPVILVVDDDAGVRDAFRLILEDVRLRVLSLPGP